MVISLHTFPMIANCVGVVNLRLSIAVVASTTPRRQLTINRPRVVADGWSVVTRAKSRAAR